MAMPAGLGQLIEDVRTHPVSAVLELGSVALCVALLVATVLALVSGPVEENQGRWLTIIVVGAGLVYFWTVLYPVYDRVLAWTGER